MKKIIKQTAKILLDILILLTTLMVLVWLLYLIHGSLEQIPSWEQMTKARTVSGIFLIGTLLIDVIFVNVRLLLADKRDKKPRLRRLFRILKIFGGIVVAALICLVLFTFAYQTIFV